MFNTTDLISDDSLFIGDSIRLGTGIDSNYATSKQNPTVFIVGGGYSQGQEVRSLIDLTNNGPAFNPPTQSDIVQAIASDSTVFQIYPNLVDYPYFAIVPGDPSSVIDSSSEYPVWRILGRGRGIVWWFVSGENRSGNAALSVNSLMSWYYGSGVDAPIELSQIAINTVPRWPYSGNQSSGLLVQMDLNDSKVAVIPYQAGRGIPMWDPTNPYYSGSPWGIPMVPDTEMTLEPTLSEGAVAGNNIACIGVSLESNGGDPLWRYPDPGVTQRWKPWAEHIAPWAAPPQNLQSPINSAGTRWAPWTTYYSYASGEAIPILTDGAVSMSIGAATNIGAQAYYVPEVEEGDDPRGNPKYVSVSIVPLFQGEEILIGSQAYATAQGVVITPRPQGRSPYPVVSYSDATGCLYYDFDSLLWESTYGTQMDGRRCNPYYDYFDTTYGSCGWTSTPQMKLSAIPDQGVTIASTKASGELPYLAQSVQGSCFVMARTTTNPLDENGSGRATLVGPSRYVTNRQISALWYRQDWDRWARIDRFPGVPGRSLSVGGVLVGVSGAGQWPYTGVLNGTETTTFIEGGVGYELGVYNTRTSGAGSGMTIEVTTVDSVGTITAFVINSAGSGYVDGDIVYIVKDLFTLFDYEWGADTLTWYQNTAYGIVNGVTIDLVGHGTEYRSDTYVTCTNISASMFIIGLSQNTLYQYNLKGNYMVSATVIYVSDYSRYPVGTKVGVINFNVHRDNWAQFIVTANDGATITFALEKPGGMNAYEPYIDFMYTTEIVGMMGPTVRIIADTNGYVTSIDLIDVPPGNRESDILLIDQHDSKKNCLFQLDTSNVVDYVCRLVTGGNDYWWDDSFLADARTDTTFVGITNLTPNTVGVYESGVDTSLEGDIGATDPWGSVTNVYFPHNITYTGQFGEIMTLYQTYPFDIASQPVAGAQPAAGWPSYVYRRTATYYQDTYLRIIDPGSGYAVGDLIAVTGGTGTGMEIYVTEVSSTAVTRVRLGDIGENYVMGDIVTLGAGGARVVLRFPPSKELGVFGTGSSTFASFANVVPLLYWDCELLSGGTGYAAGAETATCDAPAASDLEVNLLVVEAGVVLDLEIVIPNYTTPISNNQLGYVYSVTTGGTGCQFRLVTPLVAQRFVMTKGGSGYTTATGVSTYNMTSNNMNLIADFSVAGQCLAIDYGVTDIMPLTNDLTRYTAGDVLAYDQDGNQTATAEILTLDPDTQSITFSQTTNGVGYTAPAGNYGFVPTLNTSHTATTVDIVADSDGVVTSVTINTAGSDLQYGDSLVIEAGDDNAVFRWEAERDVPPQWQEVENNRSATATEWNAYATTMGSAVNLLDIPAVVAMRKNAPWHYNQSYYAYGDPDNKDPNDAGWTENPGPL